MQNRLVNTHPVSAQEIEFLRINSPVFAVAFMAFGAMVSLAGVVFSTPLPTNPHGIFLTLFLGALVLRLFLGIQTIWGFVTTDRLVKEIKKRPPTSVA